MVRRLSAVIVVVAASLTAAGSAGAHLLDHPIPSFSQPAPLSTEANSGGQDAEWELVTTIPTGNAHSDLDFFTRGGDTYASVGTLGVGPNAGGQTIVRLTNGGAVKPSYVTGHPSASCITTTQSATGLQHDVEATPKGGTFLQQPNPFVAKGDAQLLVEATDAAGRCHDQGVLGQSAPQGGLEIIDITDPAKPKEIGLTVHVGQAHTVNVDPKRPHIAFDVTQDGVPIENGKRANETTGLQMDGFEVVDMSSCMNFPAGVSIAEKRDRCRPQVYRYRYPQAEIGQSHTYPALSSCHELEIYPDDKVSCASIDATALFDMSGAFDDNGTPNDFTDDKPRGKPLPCRVRASSSTPGAFTTGAKVTDCQTGELDGKPQSLTVSEWLKIGSPSLEGVKWLGTIPHLGIQTGTGQNPSLLTAPFNAKQDIVAAHESEYTQSGRYVITSDERGGGVVPGGATCSPGVDNERGNGGLHFFPTANFTTRPPRDPAGAQALYAKTGKGERAIYRAPIDSPTPEGTFCTSHVFEQIPGQNRIFMGWYSQGTQVMDFTENPDGSVDFKQSGYFIPERANTWVSHIFKVQENKDGSFTYWGATGDGVVPGAGRASIDVYKVTLPPPPKPRTDGPIAGTPQFPISDTRGIDNAAQPPACARTAAFESVSVRPKGRGLRIGFSRRAGASGGARVELFRQSDGRRIVGERRVRNFGSRRGGFTFDGRGGRIGDGYYFLRLRLKAADGSTDVRRVALRRSRGRFAVRPDHHRQASCELVRSFKLSSTVFGGRSGRPLGIAFQLTEPSRVTVEVRRGGKLVKRYAERMYMAGRFHRLRLAGGASKLPRGDYRVTLKAQRPGRSAEQVLTARKL